MKNISRLRSIAIIVILAASMAMSVIFGLVSAKVTLRDNNEKDCRMTAALVSNAIDNSFLRPMTVSETMSKDASLRDYLKKSGASADAFGPERHRGRLPRVRQEVHHRYLLGCRLLKRGLRPPFTRKGYAASVKQRSC